MKKCLGCAEKIHDDASVCRFCGTAEKRRFNGSEWFGRSLAVIALCVSIWGAIRVRQADRLTADLQAAALVADANRILAESKPQTQPLGLRVRIESPQVHAKR